MPSKLNPHCFAWRRKYGQNQPEFWQAHHPGTSIAWVWMSSLFPKHFANGAMPQGRTPQVHEQACHCTSNKLERIFSIASGWVVADTSPLMTAVYSDYIFQDKTLYAASASWNRRQFDLTLVMGLDPALGCGWFATRWGPCARILSTPCCVMHLQSRQACPSK
jgi:hypothetical protein